MNTKPEALSLKSQISFITAMCLLMGTLVYGFIQVKTQTATALELKLQETEALARTVSISATADLFNHNLSAIEELLMQTSSFPALTKLSITDPRGKVLSQVVRTPNGFVPVFGPHSARPPSDQQKSLSHDHHTATAWQPVMLGTQHIGWANVELELEYVNLLERRIWRQTALAGLLIFLLGFLAIQWLLSKRMRALSNATEFAKSLDQMRCEQISEDLGARELDELASVLNQTSRKLVNQQTEIVTRSRALEVSNRQLQERIKELKCIYSVSRILGEPGITIESGLERAAGVIGEGWQFPELTSVRIESRGASFTSPDFVASEWKMTQPLALEYEAFGSLEVYYRNNPGSFDEGPFLKEERDLINELAHRLARFIKRKQHERNLQAARDLLEERVKARTVELEEARRIAEAASQVKSEFLSSMSHELRTPLNSIIGYAQLLENNANQHLSEEELEDVQQILSAGRHLVDLINEVLNLSRLETSTLSVNPERIVVREILEETVAMTHADADKRGITINVDAHDSVWVYIDPVRLRQIFLNLLSNAIKYNRKNGQITIVQSIENGRVRISVSDTGPGIPRDKLGIIFEPFERLDAAYEIEGTGIGLTVTKKLVELMGGTIGVQSSVGEGSTFWVEFDVMR